MSKFSNQRRFRMERLEDRRMMAGDVKATMKNGTLFIEEAPNSIGGAQNFEIVQLAADKVRLVGKAGTKINGNNSADFQNNFGVGVNAKLGGGKDSVVVTGIGGAHGFRGLAIDTSDRFANANDEDVVIVRNATVSRLDVVTGSGGDIVQVVNSQVAGGLNIRAGIDAPGVFTDKDTVILQGTRVQRSSLAITTGASSDVVILKGVDATGIFQGSQYLGGGHISVNAGEGGDTIKVGSNLLGTGPADLTPVTADGTIHIVAGTDAQNESDSVQMQDVFVGQHMVVELGAGTDFLDMVHASARGFISLAGQKGNDTMRLTEIESFDNVYASMGEGSDTLTITNVKAPKVELDGGDGDGYDKLFFSQSPNIPTLIRRGFEEINGQKLIKKVMPPSSGVLIGF